MTTSFVTRMIRTFVGTPAKQAPPEDTMNAEDEGRKGLFAELNIVVVRSSTLSSSDASQIVEQLKLHDADASVYSYDVEDSLPLDGITHIVSTTADYPQYHQAADRMIHTVKPTWVEHSLAKRKLQNPRQYSPDPQYFMHDVVACSADLPDGDADAIHGGVLAMGGLFSAKLTSQTTHIIALSLDSDVCHYALKKQMDLKVVLPHWVDDCLKIGRKIDESPYELPDPEILNTELLNAPGAKSLPQSRRQGQVSGATDTHPPSSPLGLTSSPTGPRRTLSVFRNKKVCLSKDLAIGPHIHEVLKEVILNSGGKLVSSPSQCTMFVCKYRQGNEYKIAARSGKQVGNLSWLYNLIVTDRWTSPFNRLLHYPVDPKGIPGFQAFKISVSNYTGDARTYLENLITACGGTCTKTLKQDNTHLITAYDKSEKCNAAREWNIHLVNHLWLEESYAKWTVASISNSRYTHFPRRTNLGDVVGQTQIDRKVLEKLYYPGEIEIIDDNASDTTKVPVKRATAKTVKATELRTPAASRFIALEKENITPSTSGRKSKEAAAAKIHELTPDMLLYEKERKRVGGVVYGGGRRGKSAEGPGGQEVSRKRSVDEMADGEDAAEVEQKKKPKTGLPPASMHILITTYPRWKDAPKVEDSDRAKLRQLGIMIVADASRATHLAAPRIVRTVKFISAMAYAPTIISTEFLDSCLDTDELQDPEDFKLVDKEQEKKLGLSLTLSKERAKENRCQLLEGRSIYCLPDVNGGFDTYNQIVSANGGACMLYQGRKGVRVKSYRAGGEGAEDDITEVYLLSPEDGHEKLWQQFRSMAEASRMTPRIVTTDWLIETAMRQEILPVSKYELSA